MQFDCYAKYLRISIHAPARGATSVSHADWHGDGISIHAPARGATIPAYDSDNVSRISIHAPARGATLKMQSPPRHAFISIHAPARGATISPGKDDGIKSNFNPRSRKGSDNFWTLFYNVSRISIHAPARGATGGDPISPLDGQISIHAPARGATIINGERILSGAFQSTLPQGERPVLAFGMPTSESFQSTLPQGERQRQRTTPLNAKGISIHAPARGATNYNGVRKGGNTISIHAPARGATVNQYLNGGVYIISIHAPARGATKRLTALPVIFVYFNPRSRKGSDNNWRRRCPVHHISIHAPARGATIVKFYLWPTVTISIHAPARGATIQNNTAVCRRYHFNPRSRKGSDVGMLNPFPPTPNFNPRSRKGSDRFRPQILPHSSISIHAPARGATFFKLFRGSANNQFQSTLPQGERRQTLVLPVAINSHFNPRSRKGSDDPLVNYDLTITISIHAPARGATILFYSR